MILLLTLINLLTHMFTVMDLASIGHHCQLIPGHNHHVIARLVCTFTRRPGHIYPG